MKMTDVYPADDKLWWFCSDSQFQPRGITTSWSLVYCDRTYKPSKGYFYGPVTVPLEALTAEVSNGNSEPTG